jgi:hypothetical protein
LDWNGNREWSYKLSDSVIRLYHDFVFLPSNSILALVYERIDRLELANSGKDSALVALNDELWSEIVIEVSPSQNKGGNIVWNWRVWDHLVQDISMLNSNFGIIKDHPELIDVNFDQDWLHTNALDYNEALDQILVSSPYLN